MSKHEPDRNANQSSTKISKPMNKVDVIKRQIIFEDDKEVCKKIKKMNISNNMDIYEEE